MEIVDPNTTTYVSVDVATKSLAIGVYSMKPFSSVQRIDDPILFDRHLNSIIQPVFMNVFDINNGANIKDTSVVEKAIVLKQTLCEIDLIITPSVHSDKVVVLIEYQMNSNHTANAIFNMIVYHYSGKYRIEIVKPSWKNTVSIHPKLTLSTFLGYCSSNYKANKEHTKANMIYLLTLIDKLHMIKSIKKRNHDDIADTLMQAIAFHKR